MPPIELLDPATFDRVAGSEGALPGQGPEAELARATFRLRSLADRAGGALGREGLALVEDLLTAAAEAEQRMAEQAARIRQLENLSVTDELTGLFNRRGFVAALERALAACKRHGEPGLLVLVDLDRFKAINDTYGHLAGDAVLQAVGEVLRGTVRKSDIVARLGGDEFAILLPRTRSAPAHKLAAKIDRLINGLHVPYGRHDIPVSGSVGSQPFDLHSHPHRLIFAADRALYRAKRPETIAATG